MPPSSAFLLEPAAAETAQRSAADLPNLVLDGPAVNELELWMLGLVPPEDARVRYAGELPAGAAEGVILRDHEGVPLGKLAGASVEHGCLRGDLEGWQRPPNKDFLNLRQPPAEVWRELALREGAPLVAWPLGAPPAPEETAEVLTALPAGARLLVLILSAPAARDDARHYRRVRSIRETLAGYAEAAPHFVIVPSPADSSLTRRAQLARSYGARQVIASDAGGAGEVAGVPLLPYRANPGYNAEAALDLPQAEQGYCVFFTGLSGSGKSTIANELLVRLLERGERPTTLLDGDLVRQNLSSELGFSKEHRDLNIKRIGFVASLIVKSGGTAICAPIAPYAATRRAVREMIAPHGGYLLIHVATPVEECERRDRKGLYAKARAGIIKEFTGISDPYEAPEDADLRIDTTGQRIEDCVSQVLELLRERGWLKP